MMKKILSNKRVGLFAGLVAGLCVLGIFDTAFATTEWSGGDPKLSELDIRDASVEVWNSGAGILTRQFKICVPPAREGDDPAVKVPLMIDIHAYGETGPIKPAIPAIITGWKRKPTRRIAPLSFTL